MGANRTYEPRKLHEKWNEIKMWGVNNNDNNNRWHIGMIGSEWTCLEDKKTGERWTRSATSLLKTIVL